MDKRTLRHLEKLFAAEIEGRSLQLHPKTAAKLEAAGLAYPVEERFAVPPFGHMTVKAHRLTHAGRYAYCSSCEGEDLTDL